MKALALLAPAALGFGAGLFLLAALMMIVSGYRVDERGENPYEPELMVLWGSMLLGLVLALAGGLGIGLRRR